MIGKSTCGKFSKDVVFYEGIPVVCLAFGDVSQHINSFMMRYRLPDDIKLQQNGTKSELRILKIS